MNEVTVGYIIANRPVNDIEEIIRHVVVFLPHIKFVPIKSIDDLYRIILAPQLFQLDYVCIDIEQIYGTSGISYGKSQIITLDTLITTTGSKTKILGIVSEESDADLVRDLASAVAGFSVKFGKKWTLNDIVADVKKYSGGDLSMPKLVKQLLLDNPRKHRTVIVSPTGMGATPKLASLHKKIGADYNIEYFPVPLISLVYTLLNNEDLPVDTIAIDLDYLYEVGGADAIAKVQTLFTLANTLYCLENCVYKPRTVTILGAASLTTDPKLIRDFLSIKGVSGIFPRGPEFTEAEKREAIEAYLRREHHVPKRVRELLTTKKKVKRAAGISLTPREGQIYNIIVERGASNKHIAQMLGLSEPTIKMHVGKILKKYGLRNRTQLVSFK